MARQGRKPCEPFGVVQFDAHADLRPQYEGVARIRMPASCTAPWLTLVCSLTQFAVRDFCREEADVRKV